MIRRWWIYLPGKHKRAIFAAVAMAPAIAYLSAAWLLPPLWPWVDLIAIVAPVALVILFAVC